MEITSNNLIIFGLILTTIGLLFIVIYMYFLLNNNRIKNQNNEQIKNLSSPLDFSKDIEALLFIIEHKLNVAKNYYLEPLQSSNDTVKVNDDNFDDLYESIIVDIVKSLSEDYKKTLSKYFNENSLYDFISELIFTDLLKACTTINYKNLKKNSKFTINNIEFNRNFQENNNSIKSNNDNK